MAKFFEGHYYAFREGGKDEFLDFSRYSTTPTDSSRRGHIRLDIDFIVGNVIFVLLES